MYFVWLSCFKVPYICLSHFELSLYCHPCYEVPCNVPCFKHAVFLLCLIVSCLSTVVPFTCAKTTLYAYSWWLRLTITENNSAFHTNSPWGLTCTSRLPRSSLWRQVGGYELIRQLASNIGTIRGKSPFLTPRWVGGVKFWWRTVFKTCHRRGIWEQCRGIAAVNW